MTKVWGIGLHRTGTTSLDRALRILGYRSVHYPRYLWIAERFDAACDFPIPVHYKELHRKYPDSKFILTVRDTDTWLKSVRSHRERFPYGTGRLTPAPVRRSIRLLFGGKELDQDQLVRGWNSHVAGVRAYFQGLEEHLLTLDICGGDGWEKLCPFLGVPVPEQEFPWGNRGSGQ